MEYNVKHVVENTFGKDISSIIYIYMTDECFVCKKIKFNQIGLTKCQGCCSLICNSCYQGYPKCYHYECYYKDFCGFCKSCFMNRRINDN